MGEEKEKKEMILVGSSFYQGITASLPEIEQFLINSKANGSNCSEKFFNFTWQDGYKFQFAALVGRWKEFSETGKNWFLAEWNDANNAPQTFKKEMAADEKPTFPGAWFPLFDLERRNYEVLAKWNAIFELYAKYGTILILRAQDYCSIKDGWEKRHYAFRSCLQRLVYGTFHGGLWGGDAYGKWYPQFLDVLLEIIKSNPKTEVYVVPMNEADYIADSSDTEESRDRKVVEFHEWNIKYLTERALPKSHIIVCPGRALVKHVALGCPVELHGVASVERLNEALAFANTNKCTVFPNGDGPDPDARGYADLKGKRGPSVAQATKMGEILLANANLLGYSEFNRSTEQQLPGRIGDARFEHVNAMATAIGWTPQKKVKVTVCKITGCLLDTQHCREVEEREFYETEMPAEICTECVKHYVIRHVCATSWLLSDIGFCETSVMKEFYETEIPTQKCAICRANNIWRVICKSEGRLADKYCKDIVSQIFKKGTEPTKTCLQHYPASYWFKRMDFRRWWLRLRRKEIPDLMKTNETIVCERNTKREEV